jgi:hypothetical protein
MPIGYVSDWLDVREAVGLTAKRWERENERALVSKELWNACRDGKIRTRHSDTPLDEYIIPESGI